jgi:hypothetical protein
MDESSSFDRVLRRTFVIQQQYAVYVDGKLCTVKNKNAILKLFPDKKKELNEFAKLYKLDFKKQTGPSIISMVEHYKNLTFIQK